jgi:hypothetical protein
MARALQHHEDADIGLAVIDRMTHELLEIFEAETQATSTALPQVVRCHGWFSIGLAAIRARYHFNSKYAWCAWFFVKENECLVSNGKMFVILAQIDWPWKYCGFGNTRIEINTKYL